MIKDIVVAIMVTVLWVSAMISFQIASPKTTTVCPTIDYGKVRNYPQFENAIKKIGRILWTEEYDCYDHSKDLVKELKTCQKQN